MLCCSHCSQLLSTILNNIVEPESGVTALDSIVDNLNNVGSTKLFNPVFNNIATSFLGMFTICESIATVFK